MHFLSIFPFFMNIHIMQMSQLTLNHMQIRDWCLSYILVPSLFFCDKNWPRYDRIYAYTPCHCKEKLGCHGNSENNHSPNEFFHENIIDYHSVDTNRQVGSHDKKSPGGCMVGPTGPGLKYYTDEYMQEQDKSSDIEQQQPGYIKRVSKIEKVPRGIRSEKSGKDMASSRNLVSTIGALASPKMGDGTRCPEG